MNKYYIYKNLNRVDLNNKVGDNVMLTNHTAYKYRTPYAVPFLIKRCWTNGTVSLQIGATEIKYNIRRIKLYTSDTQVEDFS